MKEILRALAPAKRRLRLGNALRFGGMGLLSGAGLSLALLIASFFTPIPGKLWLCLGLIAGMTALPFAAGLCWPVKPLAAARAADRAGLQERAQTALTQTGDGPMAQLQRADALHALETLDPRRIPLPQMKRRLHVDCFLYYINSGSSYLPIYFYCVYQPLYAADYIIILLLDI